jgi:hypothetical protein
VSARENESREHSAAVLVNGSTDTASSGAVIVDSAAAAISTTRDNDDDHEQHAEGEHHDGHDSHSGTSGGSVVVSADGTTTAAGHEDDEHDGQGEHHDDSQASGTVIATSAGATSGHAEKHSVHSAKINDSREHYSISETSGAVIVADNAGTTGATTLRDVERLEFSNAKIAFDIAGNPNAGLDVTGLANAGQVYRLYHAAFDRAPDKAGLAYWIGQADSSKPLTAIAAEFAGSTEFKNAYGDINDHQFVEQLYLNVLHRRGDDAGLSYWYSQLDGHAQTREQILVGFAECNENQQALIGVIQNGIDYTV